MIAAPLAGMIGNGLGAWVLALDGRLGLRGWEWLFLMEGIPSVLLGVLTVKLLTDRPEDADWLSTEQRAWLVGRLRLDRIESAAARDLTVPEHRTQYVQLRFRPVRSTVAHLRSGLSPAGCDSGTAAVHQADEPLPMREPRLADLETGKRSLEIDVLLPLCLTRRYFFRPPIASGSTGVISTTSISTSSSSSSSAANAPG